MRPLHLTMGFGSAGKWGGRGNLRGGQAPGEQMSKSTQASRAGRLGLGQDTPVERMGYLERWVLFSVVHTKVPIL